MTGIKPQIQKAQRIPYRINTKYNTHTQRHIIFKLEKKKQQQQQRQSENLERSQGENVK